MAMSALDRVRKAHVAIMNHKKWCAFGPLLACGAVKISKTCKTAYTDGWNVTYGEEFIMGLDNEEIQLVVLHENFHKAYRHLHIYKNLWEEDHRLANVAMDHVVNLTLITQDGGEGFLRMPKIGIQPDQRFLNMSSEQVFRILKDEQEQGKSKGDEQDDGDPQDGDGAGQGDGQDDGDSQDGNSGGMDEHGWGDADAGRDPQETERQAREIERAVRQGEHVRRQRAGRGKGNADGVFGDLLNPKVDWRAVTRQFVTTHCQAKTQSTWRKPNRRYLSGSDTYLPSLDGKTVKHLVVGFDTSGSCFGGEPMTQFVTELKDIIVSVKPRLVTVIYCDWEVQATAQFKDGKFNLSEVKPKGGGGTDLTKIFDYIKSERLNPSAAIVLTDMYTPFGTAPGFPVLWAATTDVRAPYGTTVRI